MRRMLIGSSAVAVLAMTGSLAVAGPATAGTAGTAGSARPTLQSESCATAAAGHAHCNAIQLVGAVNSATVATPDGFGPADIQSAYSLGTNPGSGQLVAIVDAYDDPNAESDLATYRSQYGLPACTTSNGCFRKVDQNGGTNYPKGDSGWAAEISLDLDAVSAACPGCHILLVEGTTNLNADLGAAVNRAVQMGAKFVSNSYSEDESGIGPAYIAAFNHPGVMIAAATGDYGSKSGTAAQYPASDPNVVAVGGTSLTRTSGGRGWSETVWGSSAAGALGTGSGCSGTFAKPAYQQNVNTACSKRATSDVSAVANPNTGLAIYDSYGKSGWLKYGGTSLATPIISAIWAMAGPVGANDTGVAYPYSKAGSFNDVTSGTNGSCGTVICNAGTGWDGPTGVGTPVGTAGFTSGGTSTDDFSLALSPASGSVNPGSSATATVSTAVTGGSAVSVQLAASGLPSGASASFNPSSVTAGNASTLTIGTTSSTPSGTYTVTVTGTAGSTTHSAVYSLTVNGGTGGGVVTVTNPGNQTGVAPYFGPSVQIRATDSKSLPLTFSAAGLPPGVSISSSGLISGTPTKSGTYQVTVTAADSGGGSGSTSFTYTVYGF